MPKQAIIFDPLRACVTCHVPHTSHDNVSRWTFRGKKWTNHFSWPSSPPPHYSVSIPTALNHNSTPRSCHTHGMLVGTGTSKTYTQRPKKHRFTRPTYVRWIMNRRHATGFVHRQISKCATSYNTAHNGALLCWQPGFHARRAAGFRRSIAKRTARRRNGKCALFSA